MPRAKIQKASLADKIPRFAPTFEHGNVGLKITQGLVYEDMVRELTYPQCLRVFKQMTYDPTIASALKLYDLMFSASVWKVRAPIGATPAQIKKAEFIQSCMHDMQHSWRDFIQESGSMVPYGFAVHEKVYRRRLKSKGSRFDDGLIGWSKLAPRSQDTIGRWIWSDDGRELLGVQQDLTGINDTTGRFANLLAAAPQLTIPSSKMLLFRTGKRRDNPFGESILKSVYFPWKYRAAIEEVEAIGIQRDLNGIPVLKIPPQYMSSDASDEQKAIYEYYKNVMRNLQVNQQSSLILPNVFDPESKQPLFSLELMSSQGKKQFNTTEIIQRYNASILITLGADLLLLGNTNAGSFALAESKTNLLQLTVAATLQEIADVLNNDLIPQTFELNGWDDSEFPEVYFEDIKANDTETFSKAVQRIFSVGAVEVDRPILNKIREALGVDPLPDDLEPQKDKMQDPASKAGDGMKTAGAGTSKNGSVDTATANNADNAA